MRQRFRLLCATLFTLYCGSAHAVGMGELDLKSALNQRFDGEIVLTNVAGLGLDEILPNLASQTDFDRVGVTRNYQLTDLRFKLRAREDGTYLINVTSSKTIIEPFLNFIVEIIWPTGRMLREYTVLLDPPVFGSQGIEEISPGAASREVRKPSDTASTGTRREIPAAPRVSSGRSEGVVTQDDEYGLTGPGDTLWTIALKVRPNENVSVQQTMLALQRANPEAFINNNINLLKAGHVLRIPDLSEIQADTAVDAIAEVRVQNEEFQDYKSGDVTQLDARRTASRDSSSRGDPSDGELKLLAADQTGSKSGDGRRNNVELENSLAVAREDLDRARRSNTEISVRLDDLADQVETLNEIVKLKDDQLAALRAELQRSQAEALTEPGTAPVVTQPKKSVSLLSNPMVLGGIGVLLIILIAGGLIMLRKRRQDADLEDDDFADALMDESEPEVSLSDEIDDTPADGEPAEEDEDVTQQTSDVIGEAEIYIAYGRFPQAISFLQNAMENEPDRADIQLKLLEVYVQTEDSTAFNLQFDQLKLLGDDSATSDALALQAQIPGAAETSAAAMDATVISSEPIEAIAEPDDDDDDLSFDLDDLDSDADDDGLELSLEDDAGDELSLDEAMELGEADLDLDLDAALEEVTEANEAEEEFDLNLDEEIDLDFDDDTSDSLAETQQLEATESLELSDDEGLELDLDDDLDLADDLDLSSDDDTIVLDLGDDDEDALDLGDELDAGDDDDAIELDLGDDDEDALDLGDDLDLSTDDGAIELDLGDDDADALDLGGDDGVELDLGDEDEFDLGDLDDDLGELNLDEDASSKLDLARAYIEMGDSDGAKSLLAEVVSEGSESEISEANELLGKLD